jgi:hypothetical protein
MKVKFILIAVLIAAIIFALSLGCATNKHIISTTNNKDSSAIIEKMDSIRVLKQENERLTSEIHELQYAGVVFDSSRCPPSIITIDKNCNVDSILAILDEYKNKVKVYADGTIEAQGRLKSAYYSKDKLTTFIIELQRINDSLKLAKQKEIVKVITETKTVDRAVKRKFMTGWYMWLLFFILGYFGKQIFAYAKTFIKI